MAWYSFCTLLFEWKTGNCVFAGEVSENMPLWLVELARLVQLRGLAKLVRVSDVTAVTGVSEVSAVTGVSGARVRVRVRVKVMVKSV